MRFLANVFDFHCVDGIVSCIAGFRFTAISTADHYSSGCIFRFCKFSRAFAGIGAIFQANLHVCMTRMTR